MAINDWATLNEWELMWLKVAFEAWKTFTKRTLADVLMHSSAAPSLKQLRHEEVVGLGKRGGYSAKCLEIRAPPLWEIWLLYWMSAWKAMKPARQPVPQAASLGGKWGCPILRNPLLRWEPCHCLQMWSRVPRGTCSAGIVYTHQQNLTMVHDGV